MKMDRTKTILNHLKASNRGSEVEKLTKNETSGGNKSPFLNGGFAPVRREFVTFECLTVFGKIPKELDGLYCKNGPNSFFDPPADAPYHWFDGDGMLHGVDISNGRATYTNKYVNSKRLSQDKLRGFSVYNMGALNAGDLSATLDERVMDSNGRLYGRMNTNVVYHARRLLALEETDLPYHVSTIRLETVGQYTMSGQLSHPMTAHPKICPVTQELFMFGHEVSPDPALAFASYTIVGKNGQVQSTIQIPLRGSRFMHDMGLTQKYVIFMDLPAQFDFQSDGTPWTFDREMPLRFGVLPRYSRNPEEIKWFDCKSGMIFHTVNAFDSGEDQVTMQCCRANTYTMAFNRSADPDNWLFPYEWVLDLKTGSVKEHKLCDVRCDFPIVNPSKVSQRHRYSYYSTYRARSGDEVPLYDGLVKLDHLNPQAKPIVVSLAPHLSCGEFSFIPRSNSNSEDDGFLITFVYNSNTSSSEVVIYDALALTTGDGTDCCVCRVSLPQRVPYGFHGNWVPRADVDASINC